MIFAYLAPLIKAKFASTKLQTHVEACDNLVKFVSRILVRYFKEETKDKDSQGYTVSFTILFFIRLRILLLADSIIPSYLETNTCIFTA